MFIRKFIHLSYFNIQNILHTGFLQPEQKSSRHVGQCTAHGNGTAFEDVGCTDTSRSIEDDPTKQIVSQPAFGHQVRYLSNSTSVIVFFFCSI